MLCGLVHKDDLRLMARSAKFCPEQDAAKEERKRKAAAAKLAKQAHQAQQALQQLPGVHMLASKLSHDV